MSVLIKNFGNDSICQSIDELRNVLTEKYAGLSVSLVNCGFFMLVDVLENGTVIDSYKGTEISLSNFKFD